MISNVKALSVAFLLVLICGGAGAQSPDTNTMINRLKRSIIVQPMPELDRIQKDIEQGKAPSPSDRDAIKQAAAKTDAKLDLSIQFAYNSDELVGDAKSVLSKLAEALRSDELGSARFLVNGHTDARGGEEYNLMLSQRRAASVIAFLVSEQRIERARLIPVGFGKQNLKNMQNPFANENRRVEIVRASN